MRSTGFLGSNADKEISRLINKYYGFSPYSEQLKAGELLSKGKIVNQNTGEGKTISIIAGALRLLDEGHQVFIVTANDYLSKRDFEESRGLFKELGLVSVFFPEGTGGSEYAYKNADVIYAAAHTLIFDYLRGIKAEYDAVIIDEIDYILVECANHDFSVSAGQSKVSMPKELFDICLRLSEIFSFAEKTAATEKEDVIFDLNRQFDYVVDRVLNQVFITTRGYERVEEMFGEETENLLLIDILHATLTVKHFYERDVDYLLEDGKILVIDSASGRKSPNSSHEILLQTAIEEKEGLLLTDKSLLHNTCSYTVFFTLFKNLSGISGTASYVPYDFMEIYGKETVKVPDHFKSRRAEFFEEYDTKGQKLKRIREIAFSINDPVLIITQSDKKSQEIYEHLAGIEKKVLLLDNKVLDDEAWFLLQVSCSGTILISSKIVGRGTDIKVLESFKELTVIIPERFPSERAERQAIGRTGRNGSRGRAYILSSREDEIYSLSKSRRESIKKLQDRYGQIQFSQRKHIFLRNKIFFDLDRQITEFFESLKSYKELQKIAESATIGGEKLSAILGGNTGAVSEYYKSLMLYVYKARRPLYQNEYIYYNDMMPEALYDGTFYKRTKENADFFRNIITEVAIICLLKKDGHREGKIY